MTFEHDVWMVGNRLQLYSRNLFKNLGYIPVCLNVMNHNNPYEDWWIDPKLVNKKLYDKLICENLNYEKIIERI